MKKQASMDKNKIFLTGASGMLGRATRKRLSSFQGYHLLMPRSSELDLRDQAATHHYFDIHRPKFVVHMAGHIGGIQASISRPVEFMYENLIMAMNVIHAAYEYGVNRLIFLGSSCIYPRNCPQPMKESMLLEGPLEPTNEGYSLAKISGIRLCQYLNRQYDTDFISLIPSNLYGPHDRFGTSDSHVISALIDRIHRAKIEGQSEVEIWGSGTTRREFLHVRDMADAIAYFLELSLEKKDSKVFNIGYGRDISIRELAFLIGEVVGFEGHFCFNRNKPDGMPKKCMDVSRAAALGWRAETPLRDGLQSTYQWYLQNLPEFQVNS